MGTQYGFVAVPATMERLVAEFGLAWPEIETTGKATLASLDAFVAWQEERERFSSGVDVYGFLQDGDWAVLLDSACVLAGDPEGLARLSIGFGSCLSFIVQTSGGQAVFWAFQQGRLTRSIESADGRLRLEGDPLPEEADLPVEAFGPAEADALQQRLGLNFLGSAPPAQVIAVSTVDHTDYGELMPTHAGPDAAYLKRPWWKLW